MVFSVAGWHLQIGSVRCTGFFNRLKRTRREAERGGRGGKQMEREDKNGHGKTKGGGEWALPSGVARLVTGMLRQKRKGYAGVIARDLGVSCRS